MHKGYSAGDEEKPAEAALYDCRVGFLRQKAADCRADYAEQCHEGYQFQVQAAFRQVNKHRRARREEEIDQIYALRGQLLHSFAERKPDHQQSAAADAQSREDRNYEADNIFHILLPYKTDARPDDHQGEELFQPFQVDFIEQVRADYAAEHSRQQVGRGGFDFGFVEDRRDQRQW